MKRFIDKINKLENGCWEWVACLRGKSGYGAFKLNGKTIDAHRFSYMYFNSIELSKDQLRYALNE